MRSKMAMINTMLGVFNQIVLAIVKIFVRRAIIATIGLEFLGVNGLFSNVLSLLALAESGFGIAVVYKLYKPIAENDDVTICKYLNFYSKIYRIIACVITVVGLILTPFLPFIISETTLPMSDIYKYYILFLLNNVASYFIAYKTAFLTACQKNYLNMIVNTVVTVVFSVIEIIALYITGSYYVYLALIILQTLAINFTVSLLADRCYPYLKNIKNYSLEKDEKKGIYKDCSALILHKVGAYVLTGTDNIIISAFISVVAVGLYSNYLIVINLINSTLTKFFDAIVPAFGDIYAQGGKKDTYDSYKAVFFLSFELHMFCAAVFLALAQPFISLVFGEDCLLDNFTVIVLAINIFFTGIRRHTTSMKNAVGLFYQDRYAALVEAAINLVVSIIGVNLIGLPGVFIGTLVSGILVPSFVGPYFLYKDVFKAKFSDYVKHYIGYSVCAVAVTMGVYELMNAIAFSTGILSFILQCIVAVLIVGIICLVIAFALPERKYTIKYLNMFKKMIRRPSKS